MIYVRHPPFDQTNKLLNECNKVLLLINNSTFNLNIDTYSGKEESILDYEGNMVE